MKKRTITIYEYDDLGERAKEHAIDNIRYNGYLDYDWHDGVYEDSKQIGKILGINIDEIYFRGFSSQGDGACFVGEYDYKIGSTKEIREYAPLDTTLHGIADNLCAIQRNRFYKISATIKHSGHYYHSGCTDIDVHHDDYCLYYNDDCVNELIEVLRDFMNWIYRTLEKEYEYLNTDEQIEEFIRANGYEFKDNGELY